MPDGTFPVISKVSSSQCEHGQGATARRAVALSVPAEAVEDTYGVGFGRDEEEDRRAVVLVQHSGYGGVQRMHGRTFLHVVDHKTSLRTKLGNQGLAEARFASLRPFANATSQGPPCRYNSLTSQQAGLGKKGSNQKSLRNRKSIKSSKT